MIRFAENIWGYNYKYRTIMGKQIKQNSPPPTLVWHASACIYALHNPYILKNTYMNIHYTVTIHLNYVYVYKHNSPYLE